MDRLARELRPWLMDLGGTKEIVGRDGERRHVVGVFCLYFSSSISHLVFSL